MTAEPDVDIGRPQHVALRHNGAFRLLYGGYMGSTLTDGLIPIAFTVEVLRASSSPWALSAVLICLWIGNVAVTPISGRLASTRNPLQVMMFADLVRVVAQGALLAVIATAGNSVPAMALSAALYGAGAGFYRPAQHTALPDLVGLPHLTRANAAFSVATDLSLIGGPLLGIAALNSIGFNGILALDCMTFTLNIAILWRLRTQFPSTYCDSSETTGAYRDLSPAGESTLRAATRIVGRDHFLRASLLFWCITSVLIGMIAVYTPTRIIHETGNAGAWALISTVMALCSLAGSVTAAATGKAAYGIGVFVLACLLGGQGALIFGLQPSPLRIVLICGVFGAGALVTTWAGIHWTTAMQQRLPRAELGRFSAVESTLTGIGAPAGMALAPLLATDLGPALLAVLVVMALTSATAVVRQSLRRNNHATS
ncbi:MFS transporter [Mycolicibacterium sarraceniae]|uniref:MFS transporter n=1 Tax=Mycolicibacterium sarraceniae TaxID=1534348 RepID=UPI0013D5B316|nr:MFS transporter [Mycolicibacterium sarraceniae]